MWIAGRWWSAPVAAIGAVLAALVVVGGVWAVDRGMHHERISRNVALEGRLYGHLAMPDVEARLIDLDGRIGESIVTLDLGDDAIVVPAADLGVGLDVAATRDRLLGSGRAGSLIDQFRHWITHLRSRETVDVSYVFDRAVATAALEADARIEDRAPVEPSIRFDGETLVARPGVPGRGIDVPATVAALETAVATGEFEVVPAQWKELPSRLPPGLAAETLAGLENRIGAGILVRMADAVRWIPPKPLYSWITTTPGDDGLTVALDLDAVHSFVTDLFVDLSIGSIEPSYAVEDGQVVLVSAGDERQVCCDPEIATRVAAVVAGELRQPVLAPLRVPTLDEGYQAAADFGIEELVGEFTTEHACCVARVTNIQRIADLVRGVIIKPGETFSVNEYIGRRTRENGFVAAGVIQNGRFDDAVGGGISQFATTTFNAAFFAGLDIPEYQSHSIYISRYPYGREATLSFPKPDLVLHNTTPHAAMLWTSYTDTSITVQVYSTPHATVTETGQEVGRARRCTRVTTFRQRVYPDGSIVDDEFIATYRPAEGLDCNGNPTPSN